VVSPRDPAETPFSAAATSSIRNRSRTAP